MRILGSCKGVNITRRSPNDPAAMITLLTEDDGQWLVGDMFSSGWLDELISVLQVARAALELHAKHGPNQEYILE